MNEGINIRTEAIELFYDVGEQIGSGQFAVVKKLHSKSSGETFAAKFIKKKRSKALKRGMTLEQFTREADVLRSIDHKGVIYLHDIFETKGEYVLVLELLSGGELFEFLSEQDFLTEDEAVGFLKQVIEAIDYLHGKSIVHLDIKPENIVLKEDKSSQIKLIDFGLARKLTEGEMVREIMGTPEFVAPEIIAFEAVGTETDMWAIGVLAYIMLSGASPFLGDDVNETFSNISMVDYEFDDEYFKDISMPAKDFISNLLVKDTSERLNAKECLAHEWMQECEDQESANSEDDDVCDNLISPRPTPKDPLPKRRSTMIKTDAFKAFTARARWQKSLNKVIAISRLALLGKKNGPIQRTNSCDVTNTTQNSTGGNQDNKQNKIEDCAQPDEKSKMGFENVIEEEKLASDSISKETSQGVQESENQNIFKYTSDSFNTVINEVKENGAANDVIPENNNSDTIDTVKHDMEVSKKDAKPDVVQERTNRDNDDTWGSPKVEKLGKEIEQTADTSSIGDNDQTDLQDSTLNGVQKEVQNSLEKHSNAEVPKSDDKKPDLPVSKQDKLVEVQPVIKESPLPAKHLEGKTMTSTNSRFHTTETTSDKERKPGNLSSNRIAAKSKGRAHGFEDMKSKFSEPSSKFDTSCEIHETVENGLHSGKSRREKDENIGKEKLSSRLNHEGRASKLNESKEEEMKSRELKVKQKTENTSIDERQRYTPLQSEDLRVSKETRSTKEGTSTDKTQDVRGLPNEKKHEARQSSKDMKEENESTDNTAQLAAESVRSKRTNDSSWLKKEKPFQLNKEKKDPVTIRKAASTRAEILKWEQRSSGDAPRSSFSSRGTVKKEEEKRRSLPRISKTVTKTELKEARYPAERHSFSAIGLREGGSERRNLTSKRNADVERNPTPTNTKELKETRHPAKLHSFGTTGIQVNGRNVATKNDSDAKIEVESSTIRSDLDTKARPTTREPNDERHSTETVQITTTVNYQNVQVFNGKEKTVKTSSVLEAPRRRSNNILKTNQATTKPKEEHTIDGITTKARETDDQTQESQTYQRGESAVKEEESVTVNPIITSTLTRIQGLPEQPHSESDLALIDKEHTFVIRTSLHSQESDDSELEDSAFVLAAGTESSMEELVGANGAVKKSESGTQISTLVQHEFVSTKTNEFPELALTLQKSPTSPNEDAKDDFIWVVANEKSQRRDFLNRVLASKVEAAKGLPRQPDVFETRKIRHKPIGAKGPPKLRTLSTPSEDVTSSSVVTMKQRSISVQNQNAPTVRLSSDMPALSFTIQQGEIKLADQ